MRLYLVIIRSILIFLLSVNSLFAYQSEDALKVAVMGKIAKYISWPNETSSFTITILDNPFGKKVDIAYKGKKIDGKKIKIIYINNIKDLPQDTKILYIPKKDSYKLTTILQSISSKNILTISDIRGFAQKKGILQLYFLSRKLRLKINLGVAKKNDLQIRSVLLRIVKIVKDES